MYFMMRFFFIVLFFALVSFRETESETAIIWSENNKLSWIDFKGEPNNIGDEVAMTSSSIEFSYTGSNATFKFNVLCKFFPYYSWSLKDKQNDYILQHEQLHFDITEWYTRKLIKQIKDKIIYKRDIAKLNTIVQNNFNELTEVQLKYDKETHHSLNKESQEKWNKHVHEQLQLYSKYTTYSFTKVLK